MEHSIRLRMENKKTCPTKKKRKRSENRTLAPSLYGLGLLFPWHPFVTMHGLVRIYHPFFGVYYLIAINNFAYIEKEKICMDTPAFQHKAQES